MKEKPEENLKIEKEKENVAAQTMWPSEESMSPSEKW